MTKRHNLCLTMIFLHLLLPLFLTLASASRFKITVVTTVSLCHSELHNQYNTTMSVPQPPTEFFIFIASMILEGGLGICLHACHKPYIMEAMVHGVHRR